MPRSHYSVIPSQPHKPTLAKVIFDDNFVDDVVKFLAAWPQAQK